MNWILTGCIPVINWMGPMPCCPYWFMISHKMRHMIPFTITALLMAGCGRPGLSPEQKARTLILESFNSLQQGNVSAAVNQLTQAIDANPQEPESYVMLARIFLKAKNNDKA